VLKKLDQDKAREMELLKRLGLSAGESKIYLRLLSQSKGEMVDRIVTTFGIPAAIAEDSLKGLADKGLVRISSNRVEVVQPRTFLQRILEQRKTILENQIAQESSAALELEKLLEPIYWEGRMGIRPEEIIEPLRDLPDMELHTARMLGNATQEALIFAQTFGWYGKVRESLFQAHDRRVAIRILMMVSDESTREKAKELEGLGIQVRHCVEEWYPVRGTLVDGQELVFLIWATKKRDVPRPVYYRPHYTRNPGLIRIFRDAFLKRWEGGKPI
jgi:sugar-specific transcriptional regulator TrmB